MRSIKFPVLQDSRANTVRWATGLRSLADLRALVASLFVWEDWSPAFPIATFPLLFTPTSYSTRYLLMGKICCLRITMAGVLSGTDGGWFEMTLPPDAPALKSAVYYDIVLGRSDQGGGAYVPIVGHANSEGNSLWVSRVDVGNWGLGATNVQLTGFYEVR
jgi:hypothetical protein